MGRTRKVHATVSATAVALVVMMLMPLPFADRVAVGAQRKVRVLDPTFGGGDGIVVTDLGSEVLGEVVAVGATIVVGGTIRDEFGSPDVFLIRYLRDGTLDATFGENGVVVADIGGFDSPLAVQIGADGSVLVLVGTGSAEDVRGIALARFAADGTPDGSFGDGGVVQVATDLSGAGLDLQPDGKILVTTRGGPVTIFRFTSGGEHDPNFGVDGRLETSLIDVPADLNVLPDGKLLLIGNSYVCYDQWDCKSHVVLVRYLPDGSLDLTFGEDGVARRHIDGWSDVMGGGIDAEGNVLVLVSATAGAHGCELYWGDLVMRFGPRGRIDHSYGGHGRAHISAFEARAIVVRPAGGVFVMGDACANPPHLAYAVGMTRLLPDGSPDATFGDEGAWIGALGGTSARAFALALQANERALVTGVTHGGAEEGVVVARYLAGATD